MARNGAKERERVRGAVGWPEIASKSEKECEGPCNVRRLRIRAGGSVRDRVIDRDCENDHKEPSNGYRKREGPKRAGGTEKEREQPINDEGEREGPCDGQK